MPSKPRKPQPPRYVFQLRHNHDPDWAMRVAAASYKLGFKNMTAYILDAVDRALLQDGFDPKEKMK